MSIQVSVDSGVAVVTLARPERRNAFRPEDAAELARQLTALGRRPELRVVVLTGAGAFSAGGDLPAIVELVEQGREAVACGLYDCFHAMIRALVTLPVPTLAAVDGPAVGLGFDLALACDTTFVGERGWFRQGWGGVGLIPGTGGELFLRRRNASVLWSLLADDTKVTGSDAAAKGLAVPVEDALARARDVAAALARLPQPALAAYVELHRAPLRRELEDHLAACLRLQVELLCSDDFRAAAARALA